MKDLAFIFMLSAVEFFSKAIGMSVYGSAPIIESGTVSPSITVGPAYVFPIDNDARIDNFWVWSDDFDIVTLDSGEVFYRVTDDLGSYKYFQYDVGSQEFIINSGWAATINSEGTTIIHGPRNDPRGEINIPIPYGYALDLLSGNLPYIDYTAEGQTKIWWNKTSESGIPYFTMNFYGGLFGVIPQHWALEVGWSPSDGTPYTVTSLYTDGVQKYDVKEFASMWYKNGEPLSVPEILEVEPPDEHFSPGNRVLIQYVPTLLEALILLYEGGESAQFDAYRNPDDLP